jgi:hypothetical protein
VAPTAIAAVIRWPLHERAVVLTGQSALLAALRPRLASCCASVDDSGPTRYYAWLPGPWLVVNRLGGRSERDGPYQRVIEVRCEYCGERVTYDAYGVDRAMHQRAVAAARAHWDAHASHDPVLSFFSLPGAGDLKGKLSGTWPTSSCGSRTS